MLAIWPLPERGCRKLLITMEARWPVRIYTEGHCRVGNGERVSKQYNLVEVEDDEDSYE